MTQYTQQVEVTETNKIVSIKRKEFPTPVVFIQWFIGTRCQYDCQYCSPEWHDTTSPHWSLEQLKLAWTNLLKANEHRPGIRFVIAISGGEPTMNPDLLPWVKWLRENYHSNLHQFTVATNATQTLEYYQQLAHYVDQITFAIHSEYATEERFFKLVESVNDYTRKNTNCATNVLIPDEYWHKERTKEYSEYLSRKGIANRLFPLHDFNPGKKPKTIKIHRMDLSGNNTKS